MQAKLYAYIGAAFLEWLAYKRELQGTHHMLSADGCSCGYCNYYESENV